ncbi:hypothetical protein [Halosegnis sp.]|uniref:hypothetical protein n=1 Tax=Halosegnis sp. TaxID=2864959 RepID=UPI0035D3F242
MTTIAVLVDPPRPGLVFPELVASSPLADDECAALYAAAAQDVCRAAVDSGGDLLVNYRPDDALPGSGGDAEAEVREMVAPVADDARFEVQVGETFAGRAGNTVTHLLESEDVQSAAVTTPAAAFLTRQQVDEAAMKLRRSEVVLGQTVDGRVYYAGFREPIDFEAAFSTPAVQTLTNRALDAGLEVDYLPYRPVVKTATDLANALVAVRTRQRANRIVPTATADQLEAFGLVVEQTADGSRLAR